MIPGQTLLNRVGTLLGADTSSLAPAANPPKIHLAMAAFTPALALTPGSFTEATFVGYAALLAAVGAQLVFFDPVTGYQNVELTPPAGGWRFSVTGTTGLPQVIYGYYITDNGVTVVYGSALFANPINLTASGQAIELPPLRWAVPSTGLQ